MQRGSAAPAGEGEYVFDSDRSGIAFRNIRTRLRRIGGQAAS
jgi:hypothetical protein